MKVKSKPSTWEFVEDFSHPARLVRTLGLVGSFALAASLTTSCATAQQPASSAGNSGGTSSSSGGGGGKQPNILVIMGDDVGWFNLGCYNQGIMSGKTPNLDKLAS